MVTQEYPAVGTDAWSRAASRLIALAEAQGRRIDRAGLTLCDVRDLQALAWRWEARAAAQPLAARWWRGLVSPAGFPRGTPGARRASQE